MNQQQAAGLQYRGGVLQDGAHLLRSLAVQDVGEPDHVVEPRQLFP